MRLSHVLVAIGFTALGAALTLGWLVFATMPRQRGNDEAIRRYCEAQVALYPGKPEEFDVMLNQVDAVLRNSPKSAQATRYAYHLEVAWRNRQALEKP